MPMGILKAAIYTTKPIKQQSAITLKGTHLPLADAFFTGFIQYRSLSSLERS
ncbi:hypothetical protein ACQCVP_01575 [Rossellomorea vietnamensis]|uniref:hypothetical protein n=1 Tax=Rossellomorea vietnamensis TaxID=218284 RepID=UPI003CEF6233